ncbi:MAG: recombinase family protein [Pseudomonadota bacterium]
MRRVRCAIYTRKSSEDGLEQDFNSLDAQREACEAYIASQRHEGWELLSDRYDDGGISGGHLERPALQRLMQAVDAKQVDQIIVYKIDRLTRSLSDFAKLVDRLDAAETSFVSVTQSFNTATSMGRLTLNMLLSFAQFEREVTAERIRDKIAASKRKGMWMGGNVPLGYDPDGRTLKINEAEALTVRRLFELYLARRTLREVKEQAEHEGLRSKLRQSPSGRTSGGKLLDRGQIQHLLSNPVYAGRIRHKGHVHEGQHNGIIDPEMWEQVQAMLKEGAAVKRGTRHTKHASPLAGKLFDETGDRLTPSHSRKNGKRLRYYISKRLIKDRSQQHPDAWRLPADQIEQVLVDALSARLSRPGAALEMTTGLDAGQIHHISERLQKHWTKPKLLNLIERVGLQRGSLKISLDAEAVSTALGCKREDLNAAALSIDVPFQMRRRGVELKLCLGEAPPEIDRTLVENIIKARQYLSQIIAGRTFSEIAEAEGVSKRRIQDVTSLALLAPSVIEAIVSGENPPGLTTDYLIKNRFSAIWSEQSAQFAAL